MPRNSRWAGAPWLEGFTYLPEFISGDEERALVEAIALFPFGAVRMHGVTARRRVAHFGWLYGLETFGVTPGSPLPDFLLFLRERAASFLQIPPRNSPRPSSPSTRRRQPSDGIGMLRPSGLFSQFRSSRAAGCVSAASRGRAGRGARLRFSRGRDTYCKGRQGRSGSTVSRP